MAIHPANPLCHATADPKMMGPDALQRHLAGEKLPAAQMRTPLVELPLGATGEGDLLATCGVCGGG